MGTTKFILSLCFLFVLMQSCKKVEVHGCADKNALNFDASATTANQGKCLYAMDSVIGQYRVTIVSYPAQSSTEGETDEWDLTPGFQCMAATGGGIYINPLTGPLLSEPCIPLNGFSFTFADSNQIYWAAAPLTGTGTFVKDSFYFKGTVTNSLGDTSILVLRGFKFH